MGPGQLIHFGQRNRAPAPARKRKEDEKEVARRLEEETVVFALQVELRSLRETDAGMSLLDAVEYITADPDRRIALYTRCTAEDRTVNGMGQEVSRPLKIASSVAKDLAFIERRARAEGF
jgi:hypothetical protein